MHRVNVNVIIGVVKEEENFMFKFNNIDKKKQEKGITLVALVVTIVVLLIFYLYNQINYICLMYIHQINLLQLFYLIMHIFW